MASFVTFGGLWALEISTFKFMPGVGDCWSLSCHSAAEELLEGVELAVVWSVEFCRRCLGSNLGPAT